MPTTDPTFTAATANCTATTADWTITADSAGTVDRSGLIGPSIPDDMVSLSSRRGSPDTDERILYGHILEAVASEPWAILPLKLHAIVELLAIRASGARLSAEQIQDRAGPRRDPSPTVQGAVRVLPLVGTLFPRASEMAESSGVMSLSRWRAELNRAAADPSISAIVLDVDSPGGAVFGTPEAADAVHAARGRKPVVAVANGMAASAAYWIASQADELVIAPGGQVGSIGVIRAHEDLSAALEKEGVKITLIAAGKYKTEGHPFGPLSAESLAHFQSVVDEYYRSFTAAVGRGRGVSASVVKAGFGEGRMVMARQAVTLGMADRIGTLDDTVARLASGERPTRAGQARAELPDVPLGLATGEAAETARALNQALGPSMDMRRRRMRRRAT
jgi:signal peptide peptidase SppA